MVLRKLIIVAARGGKVDHDEKPYRGRLCFVIGPFAVSFPPFGTFFARLYVHVDCHV
jgi:hypothetical protein